MKRAQILKDDNIILCKRRVCDLKALAPTTMACPRSKGDRLRHRLRGGVAVLLTLPLTMATPPPASGITIHLEYNGSDDENPGWDPDGSRLCDHFVRAKQIWERLLPGPEEYDIDFEWDEDISGAGLTAFTSIEINPNRTWYADLTPLDDDEFNFSNGQGLPQSGQTLYSGLMDNQQADWFPDDTPPATLEVGFIGVGDSTPSATGGATARTGLDLLSVILHEIGHALGIEGTEPGDYNIFPHHVGGIDDVTVKESDEDAFLVESHLAGEGQAPWLMDSTIPVGRRVYPSATDVLVVAEEQRLVNVHLDRVDSISSGLWALPDRWIGGTVPDETQDVFIRHGGTVTMTTDGSTRNLQVFAGNTVDVGDNRLNVHGTLNLNGATVTVDPGGTIAADEIIRGIGSLSTSPGSLVRFNSFSDQGLSPSASFSGSVGIGFDTPNPSATTFNPGGFTTNWVIAEQLSIGDENTTSRLLINNGVTFTSGSGRIGTDFNGGGEGTVDITGPGSSWTVNGQLDGRHGRLDITNHGRLETEDASLGDNQGEMIAAVNGLGSTWTVNGDLDIGPSSSIGNGQGWLVVKNDGVVTVNGDVLVHGASSVTSSVKSYVTVDTNGTLDVDGDLDNTNEFGEIQLLGGTIRAHKVLPRTGAFTWTDGTLDLTDQEVILESNSLPAPLASSTTLQNNQTLILNSTGKDLTIGMSAIGELDMLDSASVQVNDGNVFIAKDAGSNGTLRLLDPDTRFFVDGSMAVGGDLTGPGGQGELVVNGVLTITGALDLWPSATRLVGNMGILSADEIRDHGSGGLGANGNGHIRFNTLEGFGSNITLAGITAVGIAEGDAGQGSFVRDTGQRYTFVRGWIIGDNAPAQVDLINGGGAIGDGGFVHLGNQPGSGGTVLNVSGVSGAGAPSALLVFNQEPDSLIVGVADVATMRVEDGGYVFTDGGAIVARDLTASGSQAIVSGGQSYWEIGGDLTVGGGARGQLTVSDRGLVEVGRTLWIGGAPEEHEEFFAVGGNGDGGGSIPSLALITGQGSRGIVYQDTVVGFDLSGELVVEQRGAMYTQDSGFIARTPSSGGSSALVSDDAAWRVDQNLYVGFEAQGALDIQNDGHVIVGINPNILSHGHVLIAARPSSNGSHAAVTQRGTWTIVHDLHVGDAAQGSLEIDTKGKVGLGGNATIAHQATSGGSWVAVSRDGLWSIGADLRVGDEAQGLLDIDTKGRVIVADNATIASQAGSRGSHATVSREGVWDIGADLRVGDHDQGSLTVHSQGQVLVGGDAYLGAGTSNGDGLVVLEGTDDTVVTLDVAGDIHVGGNQLGSIGLGRIDMQGHTRVRANGVTVWDDGQFDLAGVVEAPVGGVDNRGLFAGQGTVIGELLNQGGGIVAPGRSAGIIDATEFTQTSTGELQIEVGGLIPSTDYDQLTVGTVAKLNGLLGVTLIDGFFPKFYDEFDIITADDIQDEFDDYAGDVFRLGSTHTALVPVYRNGDPIGELDTVTLFTTILGDANADGKVDAADINKLALNWQQNGKTWYDADFNGDAVVDAADLNLLALNWQFGVQMVSEPLLVSFNDAFADALAAANIPEPGTMMVLNMGSLLMWRRRS